MQRCYQARIPGSDFLDDYAQIMSKVERKIFAALAAGKEVKSLKVKFQIKYGISARQFNSMLKSCQGKAKASWHLGRLTLLINKLRLKD